MQVSRTAALSFRGQTTAKEGKASLLVVFVGLPEKGVYGVRGPP
jgi:hypothetical protein